MTVDLADLAAAHPGMDFARAAVVDTGWDYVVVDTGAVVFRVPRRPAVAEVLKVERRLLALLAPRLPVAVPALELHRLADGTVYGAYPRLPGRPATCDDPAALAPDVVPFLHALHRVDATDAVAVGLAAPGKLDLDLLVRRATAEVVPLLPWEAVEALREAFATLREPVPMECVIHGDLGESNLLVDGGRLTGVLDWTDAHVGDPAMDLTWWVQCLGPAAAREAFAEYRSPAGVDVESLWRRAVAHATVQPVHAVLYGMDNDLGSYVRRQLARLVPVR
ncbi:MAG TPA: phosphotransferase [Frankiaceae bacterium]|nr:phosphotransferase [Frankiaceae bacterium]